MVVRRQDRVALAGLLDASVALSAVFFNRNDHRLLVLVLLLEGFHILLTTNREIVCDSDGKLYLKYDREGRHVQSNDNDRRKPGTMDRHLFTLTTRSHQKSDICPPKYRQSPLYL